MQIKILNKIPSVSFVNLFDIAPIESVIFSGSGFGVGARISNSIKVKNDKDYAMFFNSNSHIECFTDDFERIEVYDNDEMDFYSKNGDIFIVILKNKNADLVINELKEWGYV